MPLMLRTGCLIAMLAILSAPFAVHASVENPRLALNEGYSLFYADVSGLRRTDLGLWLKFEADSTEQIIVEIADAMDEIRAQMDAWSQADSKLRFDLQPLPRVERDTRDAAAAERLQSFAPVVGRTGPDFERTLLLTLSGALNQLRHLARVLVEAESEFALDGAEQRGAAMKTVSHRLDGLYDDTLRLLNQRFFIHDAYGSDED